MTEISQLRKPIRVWPGVVLAIAVVVLRFGVTSIQSELTLFGLELGMVGLLGSFIAAAAIFIWWIAFSRVPWLERLGAIALIAAALWLTRPFLDISIIGAGQGMLFYFFGLQGISVALVVWAAATRVATDRVRRIALVAAIPLAALPWALIRTAGVGNGAGSGFHWRWTPTPEQRLLAQGSDEPKPLATAPEPVAAETLPTPKSVEPTKPAPALSERGAAARVEGPALSERGAAAAVEGPALSERGAAARVEGPAMSARGVAAAVEGPAMSARSVAARVEWPGFRGPSRDGIVHGVRINTDWSASPPAVMWRRPIGPGWSSFSVQGDYLYTQEQRGDFELVASYRVSTGEPVWRHRDAVRFYESNGGAGPRGTPTIHNGRVYAFGATGVLNALDARNGAVIWSRNAATDTKRKTPDWGFSSSPLVVDDLVVIAVSGTLAAYDAATGAPRWVGPQHGGTYSSPQLVTIDGVQQIVLLSAPGAVSVNASDGALLWEHKWEGGAIVQPAITDNGDILINAMATTGGTGTRRLAVKHAGGAWQAEERWTSNGLKPFFNDLVVHKGYAFGFDGNILSCINLEDGKRAWKGGRYGNGQLVLLADQDVLLVISEEGELALVSATPDRFNEIARIPAINGKTWNHPVVVRDVLLVRNGEEMAAFRLSLADAPDTTR